MILLRAWLAKISGLVRIHPFPNFRAFSVTKEQRLSDNWSLKSSLSQEHGRHCFPKHFFLWFSLHFPAAMPSRPPAFKPVTSFLCTRTVLTSATVISRWSLEAFVGEFLLQVHFYAEKKIATTCLNYSQRSPTEKNGIEHCVWSWGLGPKGELQFLESLAFQLAPGSLPNRGLISWQTFAHDGIAVSLDAGNPKKRKRFDQSGIRGGGTLESTCDILCELISEQILTCFFVFVIHIMTYFFVYIYLIF